MSGGASAAPRINDELASQGTPIRRGRGCEFLMGWLEWGAGNLGRGPPERQHRIW
jgi:hypothetical protein